MEVKITDENGTRTETLSLDTFFDKFVESVSVDGLDSNDVLRELIAARNRKKEQERRSAIDARIIRDIIDSGIDPVSLCMNGGVQVDYDNETWEYSSE